MILDRLDELVAKSNQPVTGSSVAALWSIAISQEQDFLKLHAFVKRFNEFEKRITELEARLKSGTRADNQPNDTQAQV